MEKQLIEMSSWPNDCSSKRAKKKDKMRKHHFRTHFGTYISSFVIGSDAISRCGVMNEISRIKTTANNILCLLITYYNFF